MAKAKPKKVSVTAFNTSPNSIECGGVVWLPRRESTHSISEENAKRVEAHRRLRVVKPSSGADKPAENKAEPEEGKSEEG